MIIAIDVETALSNPTGIGRYTRSVVAEFARQESKHDFWLFHSSNYSESDGAIFGSLPANFTVYRLEQSRRTLRLLSLLGLLVGKARKPFPLVPDLLFSPSGYLVPIEAHMRIGTIHDIGVIDDPSSVSTFERIVTRREFGQLTKRSKYVVTVSEFSRSRIIDRWKIDPSQVVSIYEGYEIGNDLLAERKSDETSPAIARLAASPFFLWSGSMMRRKNLVRLIQAFSALKSDADQNVQLVFTGPDGNDSARVRKAIRKCGISENYYHMGMVDNHTLRTLLTMSAAFIFPSTYEGFGLPIIEAMALGTPVITSNATATREIAGNAALLVNPEDVGSIEGAMRRILSDTELSAKLKIAGKERAAKFSWSATAASLLKLFEDTESMRTQSNHS